MFFRADVFFYRATRACPVCPLLPSTPLLRSPSWKEMMETLIPPFYPRVNSATPTSLAPHLLAANGSSDCSDVMSCAGIQMTLEKIPLAGFIRSSPALLSRYVSVQHGLSLTCHSSLSNKVRCDEERYPSHTVVNLTSTCS